MPLVDQRKVTHKDQCKRRNPRQISKTLDNGHLALTLSRALGGRGGLRKDCARPLRSLALEMAFGVVTMGMGSRPVVRSLGGAVVRKAMGHMGFTVPVQR